MNYQKNWKNIETKIKILYFFYKLEKKLYAVFGEAFIILSLDHISSVLSFCKMS